MFGTMIIGELPFSNHLVHFRGWASFMLEKHRGISGNVISTRFCLNTISAKVKRKKTYTWRYHPLAKQSWNLHTERHFGHVTLLNLLMIAVVIFDNQSTALTQVDLKQCYSGLLLLGFSYCARLNIIISKRFGYISKELVRPSPFVRGFVFNLFYKALHFSHSSSLLRICFDEARPLNSFLFHTLCTLIPIMRSSIRMGRCSNGVVRLTYFYRSEPIPFPCCIELDSWWSTALQVSNVSILL